MEELLEACGDTDLASGALLPDLRARRFVDYLAQEDPEPAELLAGALLAGVLEALVFPQRARAGVATIDR